MPNLLARLDLQRDPFTRTKKPSIELPASRNLAGRTLASRNLAGRAAAGLDRTAGKITCLGGGGKDRVIASDLADACHGFQTALSTHPGNECLTGKPIARAGKAGGLCLA